MGAKSGEAGDELLGGQHGDLGQQHRVPARHVLPRQRGVDDRHDDATMHPGGSDHDGLERLGVIGEILDEPFAVGKVPPHLEHSTVLGIQSTPSAFLA